MADFTIDKDEVVTFLVDYLSLEEFKEDLGKLSGIDWNPFNEDGDEFVGAWQEIRHNYDLVWGVVLDLVGIAQNIVVGGTGLTNEQKHESVVDALDRALKAPWYLEPFDGVALGMVVTAAVKFMNSVGWGIGAGSSGHPIELKPGL